MHAYACRPGRHLFCSLRLGRVCLLHRQRLRSARPCDVERHRGPGKQQHDCDTSHRLGVDAPKAEPSLGRFGVFLERHASSFAKMPVEAIIATPFERWITCGLPAGLMRSFAARCWMKAECCARHSTTEWACSIEHDAKQAWNERRPFPHSTWFFHGTSSRNADCPA